MSQGRHGRNRSLCRPQEGCWFRNGIGRNSWFFSNQIEVVFHRQESFFHGNPFISIIVYFLNHPFDSFRGFLWNFQIVLEVPNLSELTQSVRTNPARLWTVASIVPWCFIDSLSSRFLIFITPPSCWSISTSRWSNSSERDIVPSSLLSTSANQRANFTIAKSQFGNLFMGPRTGRHDKAHPNFKKQHFWNIY